MSVPQDPSIPPELSVVVPVYDEQESLPQLHAELLLSLDSTNRSWEIVYVDDRSQDDSHAVLLGLREEDPRVRVVRFRRNFGQTPAMAAGFEISRGRTVVTLDADLQNDPADIPKLLEELRSGNDIVVGWRKHRRDGYVLRRLPSILANKLIARFTGAHVHDTGCTLKAYRRELVVNLPIYSEQHRFLPVLALASGARISEVVVNHRPRMHGRSKYGLSRAVRVLMDLLSVKMISSFSRSPLQYFALMASPFLVVATLFVLNALVPERGVSFSNNWGQASLLVFIMLVMAGVFFLLLGLLAELVIKVSDLHSRRGLAPMRTAPDRSELAHD